MVQIVTVGRMTHVNQIEIQMFNDPNAKASPFWVLGSILAKWAQVQLNRNDLILVFSLLQCVKK